jgi:hypothetical protein
VLSLYPSDVDALQRYATKADNSRIKLEILLACESLRENAHKKRKLNGVNKNDVEIDIYAQIFSTLILDPILTDILTIQYEIGLEKLPRMFHTTQRLLQRCILPNAKPNGTDVFLDTAIRNAVTYNFNTFHVVSAMTQEM